MVLCKLAMIHDYASGSVTSFLGFAQVSCSRRVLKHMQCDPCRQVPRSRSAVKSAVLSDESVSKSKLAITTCIINHTVASSQHLASRFMTDVQSPQCLTCTPPVWSCLQALYSYVKPFSCTCKPCFLCILDTV